MRFASLSLAVALCPALALAQTDPRSPFKMEEQWIFDAVLSSPENKAQGEAGPLLKLARSQPSPTAVLASNTGLRHNACGPRKNCFFDADGNLVYWTIEYVQSGQPSKTVLITGSADILRRQASFNERARAIGPLLGLTPTEVTREQVLVSGRLNMKTLEIPASRAIMHAAHFWTLWQDDCRREAPSGPSDSRATCEEDLLGFHYGEGWSPYPGPSRSTGRRSLDRPIPNEILRARAERIVALFSHGMSFKREAEKAKPLTQVWNSLDDPEWLRLDERDHLEPDQLPTDMIRNLIELERRINEELQAAELLEQAHRSQLYPERKP